jgi:quercetin dioxygenase-like cupin family protein
MQNPSLSVIVRRKFPFRWLLRLVASLFIGLSAASRLQAAGTRVVVTPVLTTVTTASGQPLILPKGAARLIVSIYSIPTGARLPVHRHRYPRYAYVLDGHLRVTEIKPHRIFNYKKGDFVVEMIGRWHFGESIGDTPLRLLVIDIVPKSVANNSRP